tara:strand:+ start:10208 stop:10648 length:441 start_codon:yes stop_codon:yes gene_type:complete
MKLIKTRGKYASSFMIDDEDEERCRKYRWGSDCRKTNIYGRATINGRKMYLHRFLLNMVKGSQGGLVVAHLDGNSLNNQKYNLQLQTREENNQTKNKRNIERPKYVYWDNRHNTWCSSLVINKKRYGFYSKEKWLCEEFAFFLRND